MTALAIAHEIRRHRRPAWYRRLCAWLLGRTARPLFWPVEAAPEIEAAGAWAPERTMEEIAQDGITEAERLAELAAAASRRLNAERIAAERARQSALEQWLSRNEAAELRSEALADQLAFAGIAKRAADSAELSAEAFARLIGYLGGVAEIRAAELIEEAHGDRAELVERFNEAVPWDMTAELEAAPDLSDEAIAEVVAAWVRDQAYSAL